MIVSTSKYWKSVGWNIMNSYTFLQGKNDCSATEKSFNINYARVAELADALDLGSSG